MLLNLIFFAFSIALDSVVINQILNIKCKFVPFFLIFVNARVHHKIFFEEAWYI
jgi:hypothetical protein